MHEEICLILKNLVNNTYSLTSIPHKSVIADPTTLKKPKGPDYPLLGPPSLKSLGAKTC